MGQLADCRPSVVNARAFRQSEPNGNENGKHEDRSKGDPLQEIEQDIDYSHFSIVRHMRQKREVTAMHVLSCFGFWRVSGLSVLRRA